MGMNVTLVCDGSDCSETAPASAAWYSVQHDDLDSTVWLCSAPCLRAWATQNAG